MKSEASDIMQNSELLYKHITRICILDYFSDNPCSYVTVLPLALLTLAHLGWTHNLDYVPIKDL